MRIYLDMCCLKRPFDDQSQPRIRLESEAVLALLASPTAEFIRSPALLLENDRNPLRWRAARVRSWLEAGPPVELPETAMSARIGEFFALGFKNFDSFHLASAELAGCDAFCTTDDRLLATARRQVSSIQVRVLNPVDLAREIMP